MEEESNDSFLRTADDEMEDISNCSSNSNFDESTSLDSFQDSARLDSFQESTSIDAKCVRNKTTFPIKENEVNEDIVSVRTRKVSEDELKTRKLIEGNSESSCKNETYMRRKVDYENLRCFFCKAPFRSGLKVMHIALNKPLPSSSLEPLSLLKCFGLPVPSLTEGNQEEFSLVDVCSMCYVVISDCDELYPHLHSVISKVIEVWPEKLRGKKTLSFNVSFLDHEDNEVKLTTKKHTMNKKVRHKPFVPDVQFSFSYSKKPQLIPKPLREGNRKKSDQNGDTDTRVLEDISDKASLKKNFTCSFCDVAFSSEQEWQKHSSIVHKVVQNWLSYDVQIDLKSCIGKTLHQDDIREQESGKSRGDERRYVDADEYECEACGGDFHSRDEFVDHLRDFHNMSKNSFETFDSASRICSSQEECCDIDSEVEDGAISNILSDISISIFDEDESAVVKSEEMEVCGDETMGNDVSKSSVTSAKAEYDNDVEDISKVLAPNWTCKLCGTLCKSLDVLMEHILQEHPKSAKYYFHREKGNAKAKEKRNEILEDLDYCVVLKDDGQGCVMDHRVRLKGDSEENRVLCQSRVSETSEEKTLEGEGDKKITCRICGGEFENRILVAQHHCPGHGNVDSSERSEYVLIECKICNFRVQGVASLKLHMFKAHGIRSSGSQRVHRCKMCNFQASHQNTIQKHLKETHKVDVKPPVKCFICKKMYSHHYIKRHISVIHGTKDKKKYSCKFCDMKYHHSQYLRCHISTEHANNKWKCQVCNLEFDRYQRLQTHRIAVHKKEVHKCLDCSKIYKCKGELTQHRKRCHEPRTLSVCEYCSKSYKELKTLRNHLMNVHGVPWEQTLTERFARHLQENNCLHMLLRNKSNSSKRKGTHKEHTRNKQSQKRQKKTEFQGSDSSTEDDDVEYDDGDESGDERGEFGQLEVSDSCETPQLNSKDNGTTFESNISIPFEVTDESLEEEYNVIEINEATSNIDIGATTSTGSYVVSEEWYDKVIV